MDIFMASTWIYTWVLYVIPYAAHGYLHMFNMGIYMVFTSNPIGFTWEFTQYSHILSLKCS